MSYEQKLDALYNEALSDLMYLLKLSEDFSVHKSYTPCLKITDETFMFNLEGNRYLTEITINELIDNNGYYYSFYVLDYEDFMPLVDYLILKYHK